MNKLGIPANADNKVVAGENAKAMTKEIIEGFVREAVAGYIDNLVDATWEGFDEYSRIEEDGDGNLWVVDMQFNEGSYDVIWEEIDERCSDEGYNIDLYDWSKENDIDIDHIISEMKKQIVYENNELDWSITGWADYLCVFYKSYFEVTYEKWENEYGNELKALVKDGTWPFLEKIEIGEDGTTAHLYTSADKYDAVRDRTCADAIYLPALLYTAFAYPETAEDFTMQFTVFDKTERMLDYFKYPKKEAAPSPALEGTEEAESAE